MFLATTGPRGQCHPPDRRTQCQWADCGRPHAWDRLRYTAVPATESMAGPGYRGGRPAWQCQVFYRNVHSIRLGCGHLGHRGRVPLPLSAAALRWRSGRSSRGSRRDTCLDESGRDDSRVADARLAARVDVREPWERGRVPTAPHDRRNEPSHDGGNGDRAVLAEAYAPGQVHPRLPFGGRRELGEHRPRSIRGGRPDVHRPGRHEPRQHRARHRRVRQRVDRDSSAQPAADGSPHDACERLDVQRSRGRHAHRGSERSG